ncbi:right-handed parallel beta-helix repeat-containing protein [Bacteroidota bacterium]
MKNSIVTVFLIINALLFLTPSLNAQSRIYVNQNAPDPGHDGASWENAYTTLAEALNKAGTGDTIWVAEGVYKPEYTREGSWAPASFLATFAFPNHIILLGGFSGIETADTQRDWKANPCILSGDIGVEGARGDNCCHVIFNPDTATVDGFIIQDGYGETRNTDWDHGAGVYNDGKLIIRDCIIRNNYCRYGGGMFCNNDSYLEMERCLVYGNEAFSDGYGGSGTGGGISLQWINYALISQSSIWGNLQKNHQGVFNYGTTPANIENSIVWNNSVYNSNMQYSCIQDSSAVNIIDEDPLFTDPEAGDFSLQRGSPCINTADPANPADPDGTRGDMGMEIYEHDTIDMGIMAFNNWDGGFESGLQDVTVSLKSFGTETLTSASIAWEIDGIAQTTFNWTGSLGLYEEKDSIVIGTYDFSHAYHTLKAWISEPNGKTDEYDDNDSLVITKFACDSVLNNSYVIGSTGTYPGFNEALDALCNCGVSGPTTFLVEDGVYNEQLRIPEIEGTGPSDTIVFRSGSGDSSKVMLTYTPVDRSKPYTLRLDSADYFTFQGMTIESRDSVWGHAIEIGNGAISNNFMNNVITGDSLTDRLLCLDYADSTVYGLNIFNNHFKLGRYAILMHADNNQKGIKGLHIENNLIEDYYNGAISLEYAIAPQIKNNVIRCKLTESALSHIVRFHFVSDRTVISGNKISRVNSMSNSDAILFTSSGSGTGNEMLIFNNSISMKNGRYCFASFTGGGMKIYNNTFLSYGLSGTPLYVNNNSYEIINNNLVNLCGGIAANYSFTPPPASDYNNYYTNGDVLLQNGAVKPGNLQEWIDASGEDQNSVSSISGFFGEEDLHTLSADLDSAGTPLPEVVSDIDGQARNATHPDIGADEFDYPGAMRGDFIVGSSDTADFKSVQDALNEMYMLHVDSITNVYLEAGDYEEQLQINTIPGATKDLPVTFTSLSGDSSDTRITYHDQLGGVTNCVIHFKGARHTHFKNLGFSTDNTTYNQGLILLTDSCLDVSFTGNSLFAPERSYSFTSRLILSTDNRNSGLKFIGNHIRNGSRGISFEVDFGKFYPHVTISDNVFINQGDDAIHMESIKEPFIYRNRIYTLSGFPRGAGSGRGIYIGNAQKGEVYKPMIFNNIIHLQGDAPGEPLYVLNSDSIMILHNTIYSESVLKIDNSSGIIANNILNAKTGNAAAIVDDTANLEMIYNAYYIDDMDAWDVAFHLMDSTSVEANSMFIDLDGLVPSSPFLNNSGKYFGEAHYDINGISRFGDTDMGASNFEAIYNVPFNDTSACFGSTIVLDAGEGFDSYAWSNDSSTQTFTVVPELFIPGERSFYIKSVFRGNEYDDTVRVWLSLPELDLGADISSCADDTVFLDAGLGFDWYDWNGGAQDGQQVFKTTVDIYTDNDWPVTVTDSFGCKATDTVKVHYKKLPQYIYIIQLAAGSGDFMTASASDDVMQYQWYTGGQPISGATGDTYLAPNDGYYRVEGITAEGCSNMSDSARVLGVKVNETYSGESGLFSIYPNPGESRIFIKILRDSRESNLVITDINGRKVLEKMLSPILPDEELELDLSQLSPGIYNIRLTSGSYTENKTLILR